MIKKCCKLLIIFMLFASSFFSDASPIKAEYSKEYVIDDGIFNNSSSMSADDINNFLISKGSWLANYQIPEYISVPYPLASGGLGYVNARQFNDVTGEPLYNKSVAQLIFDEAQSHHVNPRVLLVTLQKESTAITKAAPSSQTTAAWALFYMYNESMEACLKTGSSCNDSTYRTQSINYGGIAQQIAYATAWFGVRYSQYLGANLTITVDGVTFTCQNTATRILYIYTPHIGSWLNFYNIFTSWFEDPTFGPPPPNQPYLLSAASVLPKNSWYADRSTRRIAGDFDGDGIKDIAAFYDYSGCALGIFVFESHNNFIAKPYYYSGAGSWCVNRSSNIVSAKLDSDNKDDIAILYDYGNASIGIWKFMSTESYQPHRAQYIPEGYWNYSATGELAAGQFDNDEIDDLAVLYNYGSSNVGLWVFESAADYLPKNYYASGPNSFNLTQSKSLVAGNFDNDGKADLAVMYDYGNAMMGIVMFPSNESYRAMVKYSNSPNSWYVSNTSNLTVGDYDKADSIDDIGVLYDYGQQSTGLFTFASAANHSPTLKYWSGRRNFDLGSAHGRIVSGDFNNDDKLDVATFYTYGEGAMTIFSFQKTAVN